MSTNVQFQNAYVEVLLDNFVSVVKQNVYLQTQNKIAEDTANVGIEMQNQANNLADINVKLQADILELNGKIDDLKKEKEDSTILLNEKNIQVSNAEYVQQEKNRLQNAVNSYMRQIKTLEEDNYSLKNDIDKINREYKDHIEKLEIKINGLIALVPVNKLKKMGIDISKVNSINTENNVQEGDTFEIKNGGSF